MGHGETLKAPEDILWWAKGGVLRGESPARIAYLKQLMEALPYTEMAPAKVDGNTLVLSKAGKVYLAYGLATGAMKVPLLEGKKYRVEAVDTWEMKAAEVGVVAGGEYVYTAGRADVLLRITAVE